MPLLPAFTASQPVGEQSVITLTDTSTGSDSDLVARRVYLRKSDGTYLVPEGTTTDYVAWDINDTTIDIDCLLKDMALYVTVEWWTVSVAKYSSSENIGFKSFNEDFDYSLSTNLAANPLLINDNSFKNSKLNLRTFIDAGDQAIEIGGDITSAQLCYDEATKIRVNSAYYFNESTSA